MLVFGGSLGARTINEAAVEAFRAAPFRVLHAAGTRDHAALAPRVDGEHYDLRPYIEDFGEALAACDLCVARAGGSIFEIAAAGKPAILVPYPYASADHQTANARWMAQAGAAVVVPDAELTAARLGDEVGALLGDPSRLAAMAGASAALARPDAAQAVADEVLAARGGGRRRRPGRADERASWAGRRLHFVGIGGAGMSGLALIADALGAAVTGSDRASSPYLERVRAAGIAAVVGHDAANVPAGDDVELVVSTAIGAGEPRARRRRASAACARSTAARCSAS